MELFLLVFVRHTGPPASSFLKQLLIFLDTKTAFLSSIYRAFIEIRRSILHFWRKMKA